MWGNRVANLLILAGLVPFAYLAWVWLSLEDDNGDRTPLDLGGGYEEVCLDAAGSREFANGANILRYDGDEPLTVDSVDLSDGRGLRLVEVLVVPLREEPLGMWAQWPPPGAGRALASARPAEGATMSADGVTAYNLVAHLRRVNPAKPVEAPGLRIFYSVGDEEFGDMTPIRLGVAGASGRCERPVPTRTADSQP